MTRGVVLDLDQFGPPRLSHSRPIEFNVGPGDVPGRIFSKIFRVAHARCDF